MLSSSLMPYASQGQQIAPRLSLERRLCQYFCTAHRIHSGDTASLLSRHTLCTGITEQHQTAASMFSQPSINKARDTGSSRLFTQIELLVGMNGPVKLSYFGLDSRLYLAPWRLMTQQQGLGHGLHQSDLIRGQRPSQLLKPQPITRNNRGQTKAGHGFAAAVTGH